MLKFKKNKYNIKKSSELEVFLTTGLEVYSAINQKNKKKIINKSKIENSKTDEKIDQLLSTYEKNKKIEFTEKRQIKDEKPYLEFVEMGNNFEKKLQTKNIEKTNLDDKIIKQPSSEIKELSFNIKDEKENTKELKFNIAKKTEETKKSDKKEKKNNNKGFFKFKSKKIDEKPEIITKPSDFKKQEIKKKKKRSFFNKSKKIDEKNNDKNITKKSDSQSDEINKDTISKEKTLFDEDIKKVLLITDNLLEKLPEDVINEFIKSKDFELYERVINKIK